MMNVVYSVRIRNGNSPAISLFMRSIIMYKESVATVPGTSCSDFKLGTTICEQKGNNKIGGSIIRGKTANERGNCFALQFPPSIDPHDGPRSPNWHAIVPAYLSIHHTPSPQEKDRNSLLSFSLAFLQGQTRVLLRILEEPLQRR